MIVAGLGGVLACEREGAGIECGVVEDEAEVAVVERLGSIAVVAECGGESEGGAGAVVGGAVDEEAVGGALGEVVGSGVGVGG